MKWQYGNENKTTIVVSFLVIVLELGMHRHPTNNFMVPIFDSVLTKSFYPERNKNLSSEFFCLKF